MNRAQVRAAAILYRRRWATRHLDWTLRRYDRAMRAAAADLDAVVIEAARWALPLPVQPWRVVGGVIVHPTVGVVGR